MYSTCVKIKWRYFEFKIYLYLQVAATVPGNTTTKGCIQSLNFGVLYPWITLQYLTQQLLSGRVWDFSSSLCLFSSFCILDHGNLLLGHFVKTWVVWFQRILPHNRTLPWLIPLLPVLGDWRLGHCSERGGCAALQNWYGHFRLEKGLAVVPSIAHSKASSTLTDITPHFTIPPCPYHTFQVLLDETIKAFAAIEQTTENPPSHLEGKSKTHIFTFSKDLQFTSSHHEV